MCSDGARSGMYLKVLPRYCSGLPIGDLVGVSALPQELAPWNCKDPGIGLSLLVLPLEFAACKHGMHVGMLEYLVNFEL